MFLLTLFGFFMAILANMTGIEGGMIFVPLFILLFGLSPQQAAGVSMATMVFGLGAGSLAYARQRRIDFRLGFALLAASLPGTIVGALLTPYLPAKALELLLGLLLVPLGFRMIFHREPGKAVPAVQKSSDGWRRVWTDRGETEFRYTIRRLPLGLVIYFLIGVIAGLLGIGGGAIKVPTLIFLLGLPPHIAVATSVFTMALTALVGGLTHGAIGHVLPDYVLSLVPGVLIGSQVGVWLAKRTPAVILMKLLGWVVVLIGSVILFKAFGLSQLPSG
ncbi:MAG: hypothetical protein A3J94_14635 [Syntrophus sp. RIFOXYC2_FULL_54_9]|nr:MAG: hypothetical protein A3J94_14635 [Syntrophus sp. RIFOXYC2_FULL_54_9]